MEGRKGWISRDFDDGVFLLTGSLQPDLGGGVMTHNISLSDFQRQGCSFFGLFGSSGVPLAGTRGFCTPGPRLPDQARRRPRQSGVMQVYSCHTGAMLKYHG